MEILFGYFAFVCSFFLIGALILFAVEKLLILSFDQLREYLYPTPVLPAEVKAQVLKEAGDFVHAKHRVGEHDYFHEYLWVANERLSMKWEEMLGDKN